MTLSNHDLSANKQLALLLIGQHCGGAAIGEAFQTNLPHFQRILPTTWKALGDDGSLHMTTPWHFQLTPQGWISALEATGTICDEQMKKDLGKLCAALKGRLERTEGSAMVATQEIVTETGLPHYWVVNVIHSHLIKRCLKSEDANWARDDEMESMIEVPITFGHRL
jgi:hypothetical protein